VKRILDVLHCRVENILKSWASYLTIADANPVFGEQMNAVTVMLRKKYKKYMESIVEKLVSNVSKCFFSFSSPYCVILHPKHLFMSEAFEAIDDCFQTQTNRSTRLKRILEETKDTEGEAEIRERMQVLCAQLTDCIRHLHNVFSSRIFVAICRGFWDRMGQV